MHTWLLINFHLWVSGTTNGVSTFFFFFCILILSPFISLRDRIYFPFVLTLFASEDKWGCSPITINRVVPQQSILLHLVYLPLNWYIYYISIDRHQSKTKVAPKLHQSRNSNHTVAIETWGIVKRLLMIIDLTRFTVDNYIITIIIVKDKNTSSWILGSSSSVPITTKWHRDFQLH